MIVVIDEAFLINHMHLYIMTMWSDMVSIVELQNSLLIMFCC